MREISRRKFLKSASQTGLAMSAAAIAGRMGTAQSATTRVVIDTEKPKASARMTLQLPARSYSVLSLAM